ncbi:MAG: chlorite dismutase family protein [Acidimicrobiia bacterium]
MESVTPSEGWGVLHLFYTVDRRAAAEPGVAKEILDAVAAMEADGHQVLVSVVLGHKADLGVMALGPDLARLGAFESELAAVPALHAAWSYLSLTELSEYKTSEEEERARLGAHSEGLPAEAVEDRMEAWRIRMAKYAEDKLHPRLPRKKLICFYPMSKRRGEGANWYELGFDDRRRLMGGHARVGMSYAGRVLQLVTGSFAFDDWEWGVTLLADDPVALKDILYEMRFDEVSARYGEFGPFLVGLLAEPEEALRRAGIR